MSVARAFHELASALRRLPHRLLLTALLPLQVGASGHQEHPAQGSLVEAGPEEPLSSAELEEAMEAPPTQPSIFGIPDHDPEARPSPRRGGTGRGRGDLIASWVTSREILYASVDHRGEERLYSGRVYLPTRWSRREPLAVPLVVYVHATEAELEQIPQFNRGSEAMVGAMAAYLHSFVVAMPDLPGYGHDPCSRPHPYCHAKSLAFSVLDMIRPVLQLLDPTKLRWDGRIFLMGYSSGGYGAMAAVKEWHSNPRYAEFPLTAAACMGAPFHFSESTRAFLSEDTAYQRPDIQAFLLRAYHDLYPESGIFAPGRALKPELLAYKAEGPDQGKLDTWLTGAFSGAAICEKIKTRLTGRPDAPITANTVMNPRWVEEQLLDPAWPDTEVGRILKENDLVGGWHPRIPMLLASSPQDECVPASNTFILMEDWAQRGCTAKVEFYPLTLLGLELDHLRGAALAFEKAFRWFRTGAYATPAHAPLRSRL